MEQTDNSGTHRNEEKAIEDDPCKCEKIIAAAIKDKKWKASEIAALIISFAAFIAACFSAFFSAESNGQIAKQFEIENRPFIIFDRFNATPIKPDSIEKLSIYLRNVSKTPALIIGVRYGNQLTNDTDVVRYNWFDYPYNNIFVTSDERLVLPYSEFKVTPKLYTDMTSNLIRAFFYGEITFYDIVSKKKYRYTYSVRMMPNGNFRAMPLNNKFEELGR